MALTNWIDLTQTLKPGIPDWDGCCGFKLSEEIYEEEGVNVQELSTPSGIGTHMDAPKHFFESGLDVASLELSELIAPACVIDVRKQVHEAYFVSLEDVRAFEVQHGKIPDNA